jgi:hypothetical protein
MTIFSVFVFVLIFRKWFKVWKIGQSAFIVGADKKTGNEPKTHGKNMQPGFRNAFTSDI